MKIRALLLLVIGIWIGATIAIGAVVSYNLAGFEDLFARNPPLASQAGFDPADSRAKKESLLWVFASELNRAVFAGWNLTQLAIGALAIALALIARARWPIQLTLVLALALVAYLQLVLEPELVRLGRALDFVPRDPPPPGIPDFQRFHGLYFAAETLRFGLVLLAGALLVLSPMGGRASH